jgi:hypothetical protein
MTLSAGDAVQRNSGTFVGTTGTATLPVATTAGNTVILVVSQNAGMVTPAGFTSDCTNTLLTPKLGIFRKSNVGAESSWTIAPSSTSIVTWVVTEYTALDLVNPLDVKVSVLASGTGATLSTGSTPVSSTYDGLIIAAHVCQDTTSPTPGTWSGHTGGLVEVAEQGGNNGTISLGLSVSETYSLSVAAWQSTATKTAPVGQASTAAVIVYTAAGARRAADIVVCAGFGMGTTTGLAAGAAGAAYFDAVVGTPAVVTSAPRTGSYCLELSGTAAAESVSWTVAGQLFNAPAPQNQQCNRFSVYFPTSLPGADVVLYSSEPTTLAQSCIVRFKNATSKLSIQVGTGTEVSSDAVVTTNTWISVDYRIDGRTTTHLADWRVKYSDATDWVPQTQASMAAATVVTAGWAVRLGWTASSTATVRYADVVVSGVGGHYPLGDYKIVTLGVDPTGTYTLSGTAANFNTFTANGTLAAWNATTAKNNTDEWPPTLGASADGFCQVVAAGSDYIEMPMSTVDAATTYSGAIRGARVVVPLWAATNVASTLAVSAFDGTTDMQFAGTADYAADNTTATGWLCRMIKPTTARQDWTQAKLDALTVRVGRSNDVSPVVGVHGASVEVAIRIGDLVQIMTSGDGFAVDFRIDPDSGGVIAIIITTPPGTRGGTFSWTVSGTPDSVYVPPNTVQTEVIAATDIAQMTDQSFEPDP